jgi:hypothetical protein
MPSKLKTVQGPFGLVGQGSTFLKAQADLGEKALQFLQKLDEGDWSPVRITAGTQYVVLYRKPEGWVYSVPRSISVLEGVATHRSPIVGGDPWIECHERARYHLAQNLLPDVRSARRAVGSTMARELETYIFLHLEMTDPQFADYVNELRENLAAADQREAMV